MTVLVHRNGRIFKDFPFSNFPADADQVDLMLSLNPAPSSFGEFTTIVASTGRLPSLRQILNTSADSSDRCTDCKGICQCDASLDVFKLCCILHRWLDPVRQPIPGR